METKVIPHIKKRFDELYPTPLRLEYINNSNARYSVTRVLGLLNRIGVLGFDDFGRSGMIYNDYPEGDFICSMFGVSNGQLSHIFGLWLSEKFGCKDLEQLSRYIDENNEIYSKMVSVF